MMVSVRRRHSIKWPLVDDQRGQRAEVHRHPTGWPEAGRFPIHGDSPSYHPFIDGFSIT